jgi:hypothetical protein
MARITITIDVEDGPQTTDPILRKILRGEQAIMASVADLQAKVANATTIEESAVTLIQGLSQQLRDNATDPAAIQAMADQLDSATADLSSAISANTPADPSSGGTAASGVDTSGGTTDTTSGTDAGASAGTADAGNASGGSDTTTDTTSGS